MLSKQVSYLANEYKLTDEIKEMTGYISMMQNKQMLGVNALEGRTLRERFARHAVLRELLKEPEVYSDSDSDSDDGNKMIQR